MSGFIGFINLDDQPVDSALLAFMTDQMTFRGPDAGRIWTDGHVGLGCASLDTSCEFQEHPPVEIGSRLCVVGDVRLDRRSELLRELMLSSPRLEGASDLKLVALAYAQWGEACVEHLCGDFAFVLWDRIERRLFCARDQLGVKPLFFARFSNVFLVGNTLQGLRAHPAVSDALDEGYVADFLLFGLSQSRTATAFRDLQRLPAAHLLTFDGQQLARRKYWDLQPIAELRYRRQQDYLEHFGHVLRSAVQDRVRTNRVGILMSGGLDSPMLATVARDLLRDAGAADGLKAFCVVWSGLFDDPEEKYAGIAARHLGIPLEFVNAAEGARLCSAWEDPEFSTPEPVHNPLLNHPARLYERMKEHSRIMLTGFDGDTILCADYAAHFRRLARQGHGLRLITDMLGYAFRARGLPPVGFREWWQRWRRQTAPFAEYPTWLNPEFERRLQLRERWREAYEGPVFGDPVHIGVCRILDAPVWRGLFDEHDAANSGYAFEYRHPLIDLGVVQFCQDLPPIPWCINKTLFRRWLEPVLPRQITRRPKTPLVAEHTQLLSAKPVSVEIVHPPELEDYVQRLQPEGVAKGSRDVDYWANLRPLSLALWLSRYRRDQRIMRPRSEYSEQQHATAQSL